MPLGTVAVYENWYRYCRWKGWNCYTCRVYYMTVWICGLAHNSDGVGSLEPQHGNNLIRHPVRATLCQLKSFTALKYVLTTGLSDFGGF